MRVRQIFVSNELSLTGTFFHARSIQALEFRVGALKRNALIGSLIATIRTIFDPVAPLGDVDTFAIVALPGEQRVATAFLA